MPEKLILDYQHFLRGIVTRVGTTDAIWDGSVRNQVYNSGTMEWEAATGGGGVGTEVEITNFPANPSTSTLQTSANTKLDTLIAKDFSTEDTLLAVSNKLIDVQGEINSLSLLIEDLITAVQTIDAHMLDNSQTTQIVSTKATVLDEASGTVLYVGSADIGSDVASPVWQVKKLTTTGNVTVTKFADGNGAYDNIWDNRASLTYI